jgi:hypothetical protein
MKVLSYSSRIVHHPNMNRPLLEDVLEEARKPCREESRYTINFINFPSGEILPNPALWPPIPPA